MIPYYTKRAYLGVGSFNHLEKYEFVNGKDDIPYMKWKIKAMFLSHGGTPSHHPFIDGLSMKYTIQR